MFHHPHPILPGRVKTAENQQSHEDEEHPVENDNAFGNLPPRRRGALFAVDKDPFYAERKPEELRDVEAKANVKDDGNELASRVVHDCTTTAHPRDEEFQEVGGEKENNVAAGEVIECRLAFLLEVVVDVDLLFSLDFVVIERVVEGQDNTERNHPEEINYHF